MKGLMVVALLACLAVVALGQMGGGIGAISGGGSGGGSLVNQMKAMQALSGRTQGSGMGMGLDLPTFAMLHASANNSDMNY
ncbi:hypothetical protein MAR_005106 [Mya arenaria]|uniref:Uncharacterized protein n=1 Tax=Mya arenaria TaxID=6604 RepID=A0ABY7F1R3_MYAAR|nr:hypothetical protein MAR_005106 [Mya arenaria]